MAPVVPVSRDVAPNSADADVGSGRQRRHLGVLLRPLPYDDPDHVVLVWGRREPVAPGNMERGLATPRWFREIGARQRSFSSVAAIESWDGNPSASFDLESSGGAERLRGAFVTPNFFNTVGTRAAAGRVFNDDDSDDVAVISHDLWQRLFVASSDAIGSRLELAIGRGRDRATRRLTILGVLPPHVQFSYPESTDVWLPLSRERLENPRMQDAIQYRIVARLLPGVTLEQAHEDLAAAKTGIAADLKRNMDRVTFWVEPVHEYAFGAARPAVRLLSAVALLVFVVACLNVAALLLAQAVERRRDMAVQLALGASRGRIARQLLTESALLAVIAAVASVTLMVILQPLLRAALPASIPRIQEIGVDLVTLGWMTALVTLAVVLSALLPAWRTSAIDPGAEVAQSGRTATVSRGAVAWRHGVMTLQVSTVVLLPVGGGLLLHSFWKLQRVDLGFDGSQVFTAEMRLLDPRYFNEARLKGFQEELLARVRLLPGVQHASITSSVPLRGVDWTVGFTHRGERMSARERDIDPDYFTVMGIPLIEGRTFSAADVASAAPVAIVSRSLAERVFRARIL
jgi:putative ABC transport system permease protein